MVKLRRRQREHAAVVNQEAVGGHAAYAPAPHGSDARGPARAPSSSCVVVVRCAGDGQVCGADLEDQVSRAVWGAVEGFLGDPEVLTVEARGDRVVVRATFDRGVGRQVALLSAIREPAIAAVTRVGWTPAVVLGLALD